MTKKKSRPSDGPAALLHDAFVLSTVDGVLCVETAASACSMVNADDSEHDVAVVWHICAKFYETEGGITMAGLCRSSDVRNPWMTGTLRSQVEREAAILRRCGFVIPRDHMVHELAAHTQVDRRLLAALLWHEAWRLRTAEEWLCTDPLSLQALLRVLRFPRRIGSVPPSPTPAPAPPQ